MLQTWETGQPFPAYLGSLGIPKCRKLGIPEWAESNSSLHLPYFWKPKQRCPDCSEDMYQLYVIRKKRVSLGSPWFPSAIYVSYLLCNSYAIHVPFMCNALITSWGTLLSRGIGLQPGSDTELHVHSGRSPWWKVLDGSLLSSKKFIDSIHSIYIYRLLHL